jgi:hypothetical protein
VVAATGFVQRTYQVGAAKIRLRLVAGLEATYTERDSDISEKPESRSKSRARNRHYLLFRADIWKALRAPSSPCLHPASHVGCWHEADQVDDAPSRQQLTRSGHGRRTQSNPARAAGLRQPCGYWGGRPTLHSSAFALSAPSILPGLLVATRALSTPLVTIW